MYIELIPSAWWKRQLSRNESMHLKASGKSRMEGHSPGQLESDNGVPLSAPYSRPLRNYLKFVNLLLPQRIKMLGHCRRK